MTLFLGGTKHGTDVDVDRIPPDDHDGQLPPSYVDVQTAERYVLAPVSMTFVNTITGRPVNVLECTVYMVEGLTDPQQLAMALQDAVTRWWFQTHGTRKESVAASLAQHNGNHNPAPLLRAWCDEGCTPSPFATRVERAKWMQQHRDATDHTVRWSDDAATIEGVTDGGQRTGDIQEG